MIDPRRGEIWWADLEPVKGDEMNKTRPVVVLSGDEFRSLGPRVTVPITTARPAKIGKPWLVPVVASGLNGLKNNSVVDVLQPRGISLARFRDRAGRLSSEDVDEVKAALAIVLHIGD